MKKILCLLICLTIGCTLFAQNVNRYIVKFELRQTHFTLDIGQHIKDKLNTITFELPVDKQFYDSIKIDDEIVDELRMGSMILYGSFGKWKMIVVDKRT